MKNISGYHLMSSITYGYYNGRNAEDCPPYSEFEIIRLDGTKIGIYKNYWEGSEQNYLARVIAEAAWVKLIEKEYR